MVQTQGDISTNMHHSKKATRTVYKKIADAEFTILASIVAHQSDSGPLLLAPTPPPLLALDSPLFFFLGLLSLFLDRHLDVQQGILRENYE